MSRDLFDPFDDEQRSGFSEPVERASTVELEMVLHYDTGKAILVSDTGDEKSAVFLPKSQIQINRDGKQVSATKKDGDRVVLPIVTVTAPEWLAKEKGLI